VKGAIDIHIYTGFDYCGECVVDCVGPNSIVLTLTDGKVLEWFKSLERGNF
jgi:hypothetical protein